MRKTFKLLPSRLAHFVDFIPSLKIEQEKLRDKAKAIKSKDSEGYADRGGSFLGRD